MKSRADTGPIRIRVRSQAGRFRGLKVTGHAGLGEPGTDILCAAVSVLTDNLDASLRLLLGVQVRGEKDKGLFDINIAPMEGANDRKAEQADLLFASTILGLQALKEQYPDRIEYEEDIRSEEVENGA